ncbi:MAG: hypothetical protein U0269_12040 [Polyangiales bacterium]
MPNPKPGRNTDDSNDDFEFVEIEEEPSDDTLERAPTRVFTMLNGIANNPVALAKLVARGYSESAHAEGWALLAPVAALPSTSKPIVIDRKAAEAIDFLDQWDNENFPQISSALKRNFPAQRAAVFDNLGVAEGAASVLAIETLLDRLDKLAKGKLTDDHAKDKEANAYLQKREYSDDVRKSLREKIEQARALPAFSTTDAATIAANDKVRREALLALHQWWTEWATTARKHIKRRDVLINIGIGSRKKRAKSETPAT